MNERTFARARRAYELGRLRAALPWAAAPVALAAVSWSCCVGRGLVYAVGGALAALVLVLVWRGGALANAAKLGLAAGVFAWAAPLACPAGSVCVVAGCLAGIVVGVIARRQSGSPRGGAALFAFTAASVAFAAGVLGCVYVGAGGALGILGGLGIGSIPAVLVPRRSV